MLKKYKELQTSKEKAVISDVTPEPSIEGSVRERSIQLYQRQQQKEAELQLRQKQEAENEDVPSNSDEELHKPCMIDVSKMIRMRVT